MPHKYFVTLDSEQTAFTRRGLDTQNAKTHRLAHIIVRQHWLVCGRIDQPPNIQLLDVSAKRLPGVSAQKADCCFKKLPWLALGDMCLTRIGIINESYRTLGGAYSCHLSDLVATKQQM